MLNFDFFFRTMHRAGMGLLGVFQVIGYNFTKPIIQWIGEYNNVSGSDAGDFLMEFESVVHELATGEIDSFADLIIHTAFGPLLWFIYELISVSMFDVIIWIIPSVIALNMLKKLWDALPVA